MVKNKPLIRERSSFTLDPALCIQLKEIHRRHGDRYKRLRSDMIDTGIRIVAKLIETYGPTWFYDNMEILPKEIIARFEESK